MSCRLAMFCLLLLSALSPAHASAPSCSDVFVAYSEKELVLDLAQLQIDARAAFARGDVLLAQTLYSQFKKKYREARSAGVNLSSLNSLTERRHEEAKQEERREDTRRQRAEQEESAVVDLWKIDTNDSAGFAFTPDGRSFVVPIGKDLVLFDIATKKEVRRASVKGLTGKIRRVALSPDGTRIAVSGVVGGVMLDFATNRQLYNLPSGGVVTNLRFGADGKWFTCHLMFRGRSDVFALDVATGRKRSVPKYLETLDWTMNTISPDGRKFLLSNFPNVDVLDLDTRKPLFQVTGHVATFSPDGRSIVSATSEGLVTVWDAVTGKKIGESQSTGLEGVHSVTLSPNGRSLLIEGHRHVSMWNLMTGQLQFTHAMNEELYRQATLSPDGKLVYFVDQVDTKMDVIGLNSETGRLLHHVPGLKGDEADGRLEVSADGRRLAVVGQSKSVSLIRFKQASEEAP